MSKYSYKKSVQLDGAPIPWKLGAGEYAVFADGEHIGYVTKISRDAWEAVAVLPERGLERVENGWTIFHETRYYATWAIEARRREEVTV